jgi:replication factor A1
MKISELKPGDGNVSVEGTIVGLEPPRELNKMGRVLRVTNATLKDDSGSITIVLWNDNINKVQEGSFVNVENGYVNSWQNQMQLTLGKFGKLTVVEK